MGVYKNGAQVAEDAGGGGTATDSGVLVDISSFDPEELRGLQTWLKADAGVTESGGAVSAWLDQSDNALNFVQATGSKQPTLVSAAYNSLACIRFDGTDDILKVTADKFDKEEGHTCFIVAKSDDASQRAHVFGLGDGDVSSADDWEWGSGFFCGGEGTTGKWGYKQISHASGKLGEALTQASSAVTSLVLVTGSMAKTAGVSKGDCWLRVNGTLEAQSVAEPNEYWGYSETTIGGGSGSSDLFFDGDLCEIIHYNRALSAVEVDAVEAYLNDRWGL